MRIPAKIRLGFYLIGIITIAAVCVPADHALGNSVTESTHDGLPSSATTTPLENSDLEDYAAAYEVSPSDAEKEWVRTDAARSLQATLSETDSSVFGGLWIDHVPRFTIVVMVLPGGEKSVQTQIERFNLSDVARIQTSEFSLDELRRDQAHIKDVAPIGVSFASGVDQSEGRVDVLVESASDVAAFDRVDLPRSALVSQDGLDMPTTDIYGGLSLSNGCTTGFSVEQTNGPDQGVTTAQHCPNVTSYLSVNLPWQAGQNSGSVDAQWHTTPGFADPNKIRVTSSGTFRNVTARRPLSQMIQGEHVCKYGRTTLYDCGEIDILYYMPSGECVNGAGNATFVRAKPNPLAGDMAEGGDSGGPVFHDNPAIAYGMTICQNGNDMIFMPQNFLPTIGVQVDIN